MAMKKFENAPRQLTKEKIEDKIPIHYVKNPCKEMEHHFVIVTMNVSKNQERYILLIVRKEAR
jgi:hypothetical protein